MYKTHFACFIYTNSQKIRANAYWQVLIYRSISLGIANSLRLKLYPVVKEWQQTLLIYILQ